MLIHNERHIPESTSNDETSKAQTGRIYQLKDRNGKTYMDGYPDGDDGNPDKVTPFPGGKLSTTKSRFSPWFQVQTYDGIITDDDFKNARSAYEPTLSNLINNDKQCPGLLYDLSDFLYAQNSEICSGYHMITLRRFSNPIGDCLMYNSHPQMDIGRLVTYSTEDKNKLSDILSMSFGLNWTEKTADFWTMQAIGTPDQQNGMIGKLYAMTNPGRMKRVGPARNSINIDPMHDQNKVYGPVDIVNKVCMRDRGLNFNNEITLTFSYDLKSIDGIDPRQAMVDLIANLLVVTMNDGKFWGGANIWRGQPQWQANKFWMHNDALSASKSITAALAYVKSQFYNAIGNPTNGLSAAVALLQNVMDQGATWVMEKLFDSVGRPAVAIGNSLLSGAPIGLWHITIGNPYRPIAVMGNMILTGSRLSFGDQLGADGFPTTVNLTCTLRHARPRTRAEIEMMFNAGHARTYWRPTDDNLKKALQTSTAYKRRVPGTNRLLNGRQVNNFNEAKECITDHLYSLIGIKNKVQL